MKIEKLFVPYDIALKLKDLGFDESCFKITLYAVGIIGREKTSLCGPVSNSQVNHGITYPLFSQAFQWFFTKHGLYSSIVWTVNGFDYYIKREPSRIINESHFSATHRDAQIACINKLIELVENDSTKKS